MKRKLEVDADDVSHSQPKQLKLVPFPNIELDNDVLMSDAEPDYLPEMFHTRHQSNASSIGSNASDSPVGNSHYPTFDLYPLPFFTDSGLVDPDSHNYSRYSRQSPNPQIGLIQPANGFVHHGSNCTQIPKLKIACASGINGQRTMWSHCEQCGAISMVESD